MGVAVNVLLSLVVFQSCTIAVLVGLVAVLAIGPERAATAVKEWGREWRRSI
jgi:hypothetical protein